jgi:hypothetical protein
MAEFMEGDEHTKNDEKPPGFLHQQPEGVG